MKIAACRPYRVAFACSIASSRLGDAGQRARRARTPPRTAPCRPAPGSAITVGRSRPSSVGSPPVSTSPFDSLDPREDPVALVLADHRPDVGRRRRPGRRPAAPRPPARTRRRTRPTRSASDEDALHRDAALAGERERVRRELRRRVRRARRRRRSRASRCRARASRACDARARRCPSRRRPSR